MIAPLSADIDKVAELFAPILQERSEEIENTRRLPADIATQMAEEGFCRLLTPKSLGGNEVSPLTFYQVLFQLAKGDASAGWCAMIANTAAIVGAYLEPDVAREVFADPNVIMAGIFAPMGRATVSGENYEVTGRWPWASGSANSTWLAGGALITEGDKIVLGKDERPVQRMMIFKADDVTLIDTWHASGLKGTGSGDIQVESVVVPKSRSVSLLTDRPVEEGALYKFPVFGLLALGIASVALGNARAALNAIITTAKQKKNPATGKLMATRPVIQVDLAEADAGLRASTAYLKNVIARCWEVANTADPLAIGDRAQLRQACTYAVRTSAEVCRTAYDLGGGASVYLSNELQRRFRDAHTMTQHIMVAPSMYELTGKVMLNVKADTSAL